MKNNLLTASVIESFSLTEDPRLKEILSSLVNHLHAFAQDINLTEAEWFRGIEFLTSVGHKCDDKRQEFILLSDVLGLSMLMVSMNNNRPKTCTESTVFGPFYLDNAPHFENGQDVSNGASGKSCVVQGIVKNSEGLPIPNAVIDVWQADDEGFYDVQKNHLDHAQARGVLHSKADGSFNFKSIVAEAYPIPMDGPVGTMLKATKRSPWRPAHLHFMIQADGYETLITHVFKKGDPHLKSDPVFGVKDSLIADWITGSDGLTNLNFDFVLNAIK